MSSPSPKIERRAVGAYWFVNTAVARDLAAARRRTREVAALGFTELWIAARYLEDPTHPKSALLGPLYHAFLDAVADEADHHGLSVIPFLVPCCFGEMNPPMCDKILVADGPITDGEARLELGHCPESWVEVLTPRRAFVYRAADASDLAPRTAEAASLREIALARDAVVFGRDPERDTVTVRVRLADPRDGEDGLTVAFAPRPDAPPTQGLSRCVPDVTAPDFAALLAEIVEAHETTLRGRPCYAGLAFDEPNFGDTNNEPNTKRSRTRLFYWSDAVARAVRERRGIDLEARPDLLVRPDTAEGYAARVAYFETFQDCLMDAFDAAMARASVPLLGTHDWSGDRDRAIYCTHDPIEFNRVRAFAATDISGFQGDFHYATSEPLHAFAQKESCGKPRAMLMTDHFREPVDRDWLLFTGERHAALGIDYMLLHAFGSITNDPPLWTRIESWIAYRQPRVLEEWTARMKQLAALHDYRYDPDILVVFPRTGRLVHCGDRYVVREWDRAMYSLFRAHHAPLPVSPARWDDVRFEGDRAILDGRAFRTVVFPAFTGLDAPAMECLAAFHQAGGHLVFTKSSPVFCDAAGRPAPEARARFEALFGLEAPPVSRRLEDGEPIEYAGQTFRARRLPDGTTEYDDACLDFGDGRLIRETQSPAGGRAVLLGFQAATLSCPDKEMHRMLDDDATALLDAVTRPMAPRVFSCTNVKAAGTGKTDATGATEDYDTLGLVRRRGSERLFTLHRNHDRPVVARVGPCVVHVPAEPPGRRFPGCNVFVHHAEEAGHVIVNPFTETLRTVDLGAEVARAVDREGRFEYALFEGGRLRLALPPGRDLRFSALEFGPRDPRAPRDIEAVDGDLLEAWSPVAQPGRLRLRALWQREHGHEMKAVVRLSLSRDHGTTVTARCATSKQPTSPPRLREEGERLRVEIEFDIIANIENDLEIEQSS